MLLINLIVLLLNHHESGVDSLNIIGEMFGGGGVFGPHPEVHRQYYCTTSGLRLTRPHNRVNQPLPWPSGNELNLQGTLSRSLQNSVAILRWPSLIKRDKQTGVFDQVNPEVDGAIVLGSYECHVSTSARAWRT